MSETTETPGHIVSIATRAVREAAACEIERISQELAACTKNLQERETRHRLTLAELRELQRQLDLVANSRTWRIRALLIDLRDAAAGLGRRLAGRRQNPAFDADWYLKANPDVRLSGMGAYAHYLRHGHVEGRQPNAFFDPAWYRRNNPDVASSHIEPLDHFVKFGVKEGRLPHLLFPRDAGDAGSGKKPSDNNGTPLQRYLQMLKSSSAH